MSPSSSLMLEQGATFLEALLLGAAVGSCYDIYRGLRAQRRRKPSLVISVMADLFFWILAAAACIYFFISRRWGEMHLYTYVGMATGFIVYLYYLSRFLLPFWMSFFSFIVGCAVRFFRVFWKICRVISAPFDYIFRGLAKAVHETNRIFMKIFSRILSRKRRN